uniref:Uncharacterized protein n=1 Tax=Arundo donax TaxID=35708 RepID=A0A0A9DFF9_ARUDO
MDPPWQLHGRVKTFSVETTQESWRFDVSSITGVQLAVPSGGAQAPLQPQPQPATRIRKNRTADVLENSAPKSTYDQDLQPADDNDDFVQPSEPEQQPAVRIS